ncbi:MAG: hypothetical protein R3292_09720 [Alcanivorax sp.]|nr:hypothetical protein [Alcanivorax sp.]
MIELIVIAVIFSKPGEILREKGWERTLGWEFLGVAVYIGGLFLGGVLYGAALYFITGSIAIHSYLIPYLFACAVSFFCVFLYFKALRAFPSRNEVGAKSEPI